MELSEVAAKTRDRFEAELFGNVFGFHPALGQRLGVLQSQCIQPLAASAVKVATTEPLQSTRLDAQQASELGRLIPGADPNFSPSRNFDAGTHLPKKPETKVTGHTNQHAAAR